MHLGAGGCSMSDWEVDQRFDDRELAPERHATIRQLVIRLVALLLLASFLGSLYVLLRGIEDILAVIGILLAIALLAILVKKQRDAENPYGSGEESDFDVH